jgi:hypothetical protein
VDYVPIKGTYKVNDKIKVTGMAKLMREQYRWGLVKYRVVRQPRFNLSLVILALVAAADTGNGNSSWRNKN